MQSAYASAASAGPLADGSEFQRVEAELRLRSDVIAHQEKGISLIRASDGVILFVNPIFESMFGYGPGELIGQNVSIVHAPTAKSPAETAREISDILQQTGLFEGEVYNIRKDGTPFWCHATVATFEHPRHGIVWLSIYQDISQRKQTEQERQQMIARLEAANQELESFSYSVAHDLRTPLRAIDGFSRLLQDDYADKLDAEGRRLLAVVRDNSQKMAQLIDDILAFTRTGRQPLTPAAVDMQALAREVQEELQPFLAGRALRVEIATLPPAHGDRAMLRRVLLNLLGNAVKFTRPRADARVEVSGRREDGETVYCVQDNGVGFDMQYVDKLFGVFQRLHAADEFEGTGIGLAIVKRIVSRHGGRVWAQGREGEGATFCFALPGGEQHHE